ncbi:MAG: NADH-quinone oxidoreductase subunit M [Anaerolineae bacterium]|nr:NADH-quinone oxidoreductase subunit M [Anaerolineae bacterium]
MIFSEPTLLILAIFFPAAAALIVFLLPDDDKTLAKRLAFYLSLVPLGLVLAMWVIYANNYRLAPGFQFETIAEWFPLIGASFHIGVDGISLPMMLLTVILTPLSILASFNIEDKTKMFMSLFLLLESAMLGYFAALDLVIFFIFWEFSLVPMYFLIKIWGGADREYASFKFFVYTMAGSLGLLISIQVMGLSMGTFDIVELMDKWVNVTGAVLPESGISIPFIKAFAFWSFVIAFAIKVPVWPFHTWLPDAHTQAPTAGSMILAGVLLKLGAYGFIRLVIPLFPEQSHQLAWVLAVLGTLSIVLGGFAAFGQWDFKRLVAYSSINHMGFVVLGIAVMARAYGANHSVWDGDAIMATNGAVMQMFNHGLSAAAMFFMVGVFYDRLHTRDLRKFGGFWAVAPITGGILIFNSMASLGLPGLNGFVGEFLITRGAWGPYAGLVAIAMIGLLMTGAYILKGIGQTLHGPIKDQELAHHLTPMTTVEHLVIWPLMILMLTLGLWPQWLLAIINDTVSRLF